MSWNYRILAHRYKDEVFLKIHEVYYDKKGKPDGYTENATYVGSEDISGLLWVLDGMKKSANKPILWAGDEFPKECKVKHKCDLCGREFIKKLPHKCNHGFRKRKIKWSLKYE